MPFTKLKKLYLKFSSFNDKWLLNFIKLFFLHHLRFAFFSSIVKPSLRSWNKLDCQLFFPIHCWILLAILDFSNVFMIEIHVVILISWNLSWNWFPFFICFGIIYMYMVRIICLLNIFNSWNGLSLLFSFWEDFKNRDSISSIVIISLYPKRTSGPFLFSP